MHNCIDFTQLQSEANSYSILNKTLIITVVNFIDCLFNNRTKQTSTDKKTRKDKQHKTNKRYKSMFHSFF